MCGIVGYIGNRDSVPIILDALRRLEYRGYDSAGIAVIDAGGSLAGSKAEGKLSRLAERLNNGEALSGAVGVGHTRWATHGPPSDANAHPHLDCRGHIAVVHNGIIENYAALRARLLELGHVFSSETDTEVLAHLIEMHYDGDLEAAVRHTVGEVRGAYALGVISSDDPDHLVFARNGASPLVLGIGDGEMYVASDTPAILPYTRREIVLQEGEIAVVARDGVRLSDYDGTPIQREPIAITWDAGSAEKTGYKHFMLKEIFEQPTAARETILGRVSQETGKVFLEEMQISEAQLREIDEVTILACGTSWHAGLVGKFLIEHLARLPVEVDYGSEYRYRSPIVSPRTLAVVITQSGETADTLAALREAKRRGARSIAVCNVVGSMATRETDGTVYTHAGPEIGVASTKAFTSQLVALYLLGLRLGQVRAVLSLDASKPYVDALLQLPHLLEQTLKIAPDLEEVAARFHSRSDFLYLGRGINYPIALEGALKLKEISYIHAEGYPAGEMKHGPIALIDERMPVVTIAPHDHVFEKMIGNMQEVKARGGTVIALTTRGDDKLRSLLDTGGDVVLEVPRTTELMTPILMALPLQLLAYDIAVRRGCDVDQPRNLAKSVTVE